MAEKIRFKGDNFAILQQKAKSRVGIMRLSGSLRGTSAASPNFTLSYRTADAFPGYLARRMVYSLRLMRFAHYYQFLFKPGQRLHVAGAYAQHGTGTSGSITRDSGDRVVYAGNDAAHARLGSYYVGSDAVWQAWLSRLQERMTALGHPTDPVRLLFPVNALLVNMMFVLEATTDQTDAMMNRAFGQLESELHAGMCSMVLPEVPSGLEGLQHGVARLTGSLPKWVASILRRRATDRLRDIAADPRKDQQQANSGPRAFAGESDLLRALIDQTGNTGSPMWREINIGIAHSSNDIGDEIHDLKLAAEELADVTA